MQGSLPVLRVHSLWNWSFPAQRTVPYVFTRRADSDCLHVCKHDGPRPTAVPAS